MSAAPKTFRFFLFTSLCFLMLLSIDNTPVYSQVRCQTSEYEKNRAKMMGLPQKTDDFEDWIKKKFQEGRNNKEVTTSRNEEDEILTIPVVVHIIHNGESIGNGLNISDAQILSQIVVINEDFRRQNADAAQTQPQFVPVASDFEIEFVLAKRNPEGLPTNGINRVQGSQTSWSLSNDFELKNQSYWPAEDYLNIWVTNLSGNFLGYAQFPVSDLEGLENASNNRLTDGIVVDYRAFGSDDYGAFDLNPNFNKGRTTTHEIGHFFGLRHTWGDDGGACTGSDFVDDTPNQANFTTGCPATKFSCGSDDMFQNYLDFTNDACMNIFTEGQKVRARTVLEFSPRRANLVTSLGGEEPVFVSNDLGIRSIVTPVSGTCSNPVIPEIEIRNYGTNTITEANITLLINGVIIEEKTVSLVLNPLEIVFIQFNPVDLSIPGDYNFQFLITGVNGSGDNNPDNNSESSFIKRPQTRPTPLIENFDVLPADWSVINPDELITWELTTAPNQTSNNTAMFVNFYDYENVGEQDALLSPKLNLSDAAVALLIFDVAYARFPGVSNEGLSVLIGTNCSVNPFQADEIYNKMDAELATSGATTQRFIPSGESDWRREVIDISQYVGEEGIQIIFRARNGFGNNLYLDNVRLLVSEFEDIAIQNIISPVPVSCNLDQEIRFIVENRGTVNIESFEVQYRINGGPFITATLSDLNIWPGDEIVVSSPSITFPEGENTLEIEVLNPNGVPDNNPGDNFITYQLIIDYVRDRIPLRQHFESGIDNGWLNANPEVAPERWEPAQPGNRSAIVIANSSNTLIGSRAWLVSPVLDFSDATQASMTFDYAYKSGQQGSEIFRIRISEDCGDDFSRIIFVRSGTQLATTPGIEDNWSPEFDQEWQTQLINLGEWSGKNDIRLAFEVINGNGNNLYLDQIEFFVTAAPNKIRPDNEPFILYPNPVTENRINLSFNLEHRQDVVVRLLDPAGRQTRIFDFPNTLNQDYQIEFFGPERGLFILQIITETQSFARRIKIF